MQIEKDKMGLCRAQLSCKIAQDAIEGKTIIPGGLTRIEWAMYCLCDAVEGIAKAMMENDKRL